MEHNVTKEYRAETVDDLPVGVNVDSYSCYEYTDRVHKVSF